MPSDKISALCVMHLMKHLFSQFILDSKLKTTAEDFNLMDKQQEQAILKGEIKIPALKLFQDLGKLFDQELKQTMTSAGRSRDDILR